MFGVESDGFEIPDIAVDCFVVFYILRHVTGGRGREREKRERERETPSDSRATASMNDHAII